MPWQTIDPSTGRPGPAHEATSPEAVPGLRERTHDAWQDWRKTSSEDRAQVLRKAAALLRERKEALAGLMADEMGKPLGAGEGEVEKCAWCFEHYAGHAAEMLAPQPIPSDATRSEVHFEPLGPVLAIMPWNFPLWQVVRFLAPNLMAGNTALLKHAPNVPGCALAIETLLDDAGLPQGVFTNLFIEVGQVEDVLASDHVAAVTLTGSTGAGRSVAELAGRHLKKCVLELGGSDAYVVLEDADVDAAAEECVTSRLLNSGQSCIAAKRWIVVDAAREAFTAKARELLAGKTVGHPREEGTDVGPMAREDLRDTLHEQVEKSVAAGAKLAMGGEVPEQDGWWYPVTLLEDVRPGMPAFDEELFGPVAAIVPARDQAHALELANDSSYGLGAAVFTQDLERGVRLASKELAAGSCFVNAFVRSDPRLPFGGIKQSGFGRELGTFGIHEFVNVKTVYVA